MTQPFAVYDTHRPDHHIGTVDAVDATAAIAISKKKYRQKSPMVRAIQDIEQDSHDIQLGTAFIPIRRRK